MRKKYLLIIFATLFGWQCMAHCEDYSEFRQPNYYAFRGKVLPWLLLGTGINFSLGFEYGFGGRQAIGADMVYNGYSFPEEKYDSSIKDYKAGPRLRCNVRGVFVYYKYYLQPIQLFKERVRPYVSVFGRAGNEDQHPEKGYNWEYTKYDKRSLSTGVVVGVVNPFRFNRVNVDINAGPFIKWSDEILGLCDRNNLPIQRTNHQRNVGLRVGLSLMLIRHRKSA